jgi:putative transposase
VPPDTRDEVVDFVKKWSEKTEISKSKMLTWGGIGPSKFYDWTDRYGKANEHNGQVPRDFWIEDWEREAIVKFHSEHPLEGYRRLSFMMLDKNIVCVSPSTTYRVLKQAGVLDNRSLKPSLKGTGFVQPLKPHAHWHTDVSYINISGTFYYLASVLDGYSRKIVSWEIRESMKESEIELVIEKAKEQYPDARPRIISDRGPQFVSRDFKDYIRLSGMTHVKTSPFYPQSNGKIERMHRTLKETCIRPRSIDSKEEAHKAVLEFVRKYNTERLHSAIGYLTPEDKLAGRETEIHTLRDSRIEAAREVRRSKRLAQTQQKKEQVS